MKCPNCGTAAVGAFCAECGTPLKNAQCRECSAALVTGAKYCTKCGAPVGGRRPESSNRPLYALAAGVVLIAAAFIWLQRGGSLASGNDGRIPLSQFQEDGTARSTPGAPGPLTGTPREQADRLFNRVMTERESGDTTRAKFFLPMAIQAHEAVDDLDADGLYHLSLLQIFAEQYGSARMTSERVLATSPNHLLALSTAATAAAGSGDAAAARKYARQFLGVYDSEVKSTRPEYLDHARMLPELKKSAEQLAR